MSQPHSCWGLPIPTPRGPELSAAHGTQMHSTVLHAQPFSKAPAHLPPWPTTQPWALCSDNPHATDLDCPPSWELHLCLPQPFPNPPRGFSLGAAGSPPCLQAWLYICCPHTLGAFLKAGVCLLHPQTWCWHTW